MAFGFDASLILPASSTPQTSLSELVNAANSGQQRQVEQAKMQEMLYQQGRQHSLADLVRQGVPLADAYQQTGYGDEAQAAQEHALKFKQLHMDLMRSKANEVKTADQAEKYITSLAPEFQAEHMFDAQAKGQDALAQVQGFADAGLTPDKRAAVEETRRRQAAEADPTSVTSRIRASVARQLGLPVETGTAGNAIDDKELELGERLKGIQEMAAARRDAAKTRADASQPTPVNQSTLEREADNLASGNGFIIPGRDKASQAHNRMVMDLAIQRHPDWDPSQSKAVRAADAASLTHLQPQVDQINGFVRTFDKNVESLQQAADALKSSNSPFLNKGLRFYQKNVEADPALSRFKVALNAVTSEAGKINSGSTGQGGVPISIMDEMSQTLPPDATPAQVVAALSGYRTDSANRRDAMAEQLAEIKGRLKTKGVKAKGGGAMPTPAAGGSGGFNLDDEPQRPSTDAGAVMDPAKVSARIKQLVASGVKDREEIKRRLRAEGLAP